MDGLDHMKLYTASTMTKLHRGLCKNIVHATKQDLDMITSVDVQIHNTISQADSMVWDFDMKDLWLTGPRWTMMIRQYIDPDEFIAWIRQCTSHIGKKGRGIALLRTKTVRARGGNATGDTNKETRRWGSCMLAVSYKAKPEPQITLYSRTSYLGYLSALDLSVAWMAGNYLARELGVPVESFKFVWMNEALQYHNFKSMAFLLNNPKKKDRELYRRLILTDKGLLDDDDSAMILASPALMGTRKWMSNLLALDASGATLGDMNYNTYRRIRRRYHTEVLGYEEAQKFEGWSYYKQGPKKGQKKEQFKAYQPLSSVKVKDLSFEKIGLPIDGNYGVDYDASLADIDDDDDE